MGWIRRNAGDLRAWQVRRPVSVLLTAAGAVVLAAACVACGATVSSPTITTSSGGGSGSVTSSGGGSGSVTSSAVGSGSATSSAGGGSTPNCSTHGIGGDTLAPLPCAAPASPSGLGISAPPTPPIPFTPSTPPPVNTLPQVTAISPASGSALGGDRVTITGSGFTGATAVEFGGASAQMTVDSDTEITATSPPGNGTVDVTVVTPAGTSSTSPANQFSYQGEQPT